MGVRWLGVYCPKCRRTVSADQDLLCLNCRSTKTLHRNPADMIVEGLLLLSGILVLVWSGLRLLFS